MPFYNGLPTRNYFRDVNIVRTGGNSLAFEKLARDTKNMVGGTLNRLNVLTTANR